jgi:hypothetical protein
MLPSLIGVIASSGGGVANSYESIATVVGTGSSGTITFSSIPSTYTHLQVRYLANSSSGGFGKVTFNGDTSTNYYAHSLEGKGASVASSAFAGSSYNSMLIAVNGISSTASVFNGGIIDVLDYTSTNKNKTIRTLQGYDANGSGFIELLSGSWSATPAAITSMTIALSSGNFSTNSSFALYGIKG